MPKDTIYTDTDTKPGGSSSEPAKLHAQAKFRNALATYPESGPGSGTSKFKSKAKPTTESISTPNQVEITYNHFVSLGMPTDVISLTEFARLYCPPHSTSNSITIDSTTKSNSKSSKSMSMSKGKAKDTTTVHTTSTLTQALDFISTHLVGRQEVRKRRAQISQILEEYSARPSKLKAPSNFNKHSAEDIRTLLNDPKKRAEELNSIARRTLDAVQREWDVNNEDMQNLDIKHRAKKQELERARRVLLLLNVLEKREEVRMKRMSDLGRLVDDLRKEADLAMRDFRNVALSSNALLIREGKKELGKVRYRHTTETLAKLHRCHLRGQVNGVDRLDVVLGRLGVDDEDIKRKILQVARKRTRERLERLVHVNASGLIYQLISDVNDTIQQQQKEKDIQMKVNRAVALNFLSEGYLDYRLKEPEIQQQNGYIDKLRLAITIGEPSTVGYLPAKRVRVTERPSIPAITPQNTSYSVIPPFAPQINPNLSRKSDKSLHGLDIAADIEALVKQSMKLK